MIRRRRWNTKFWKSDVLARLKERCCPVCARHLQETKSDFFWFVNEQYYESEVIANLRRSHGFCPLHTRHFLKTGASSVITTVFSYLGEYVIGRLQAAKGLLDQTGARQDASNRCRRAVEILRPPGICRICQGMQWWESHIITSLLQSLPDAEVQTAYQKSSGLCLPHFHKGGLLADWDSLSFLSADMCRRLMVLGNPNGPRNGLFEQVAGLDRERPLRLQVQQRGASNVPAKRKERDAITLSHDSVVPAISWSPTFEQALVVLAEPGCPVCAACKRGLQDYLRWLAQEMETKASPSAHWDMSWQVCPSHFWELWASGHEHAAVLIAEHTLQEWLGKLKDLAVGLADRPADQVIDRIARLPAAWSHRTSSARRMIPGLWDVVVQNLESPEHRLDRVRTAPFREGLCQACYHIQETTRRTLDLILRVVEEPTGRKAYSQAWGLCLRHCIAAARIAEAPAVLNELLTAQITRLRILEWELKEVSRKHNWSVRYEPTGPEAGAWERAAHQFCGSIRWERR